jgi:hypothetical protein
MRRFASADLQRDHPVLPLHRLHGASSVTPRLQRERLLGARRPAPLLWDAQLQPQAQQRRSLHVSHARKCAATTQEVAEEAYGADQIQVRPIAAQLPSSRGLRGCHRGPASASIHQGRAAPRRRRWVPQQPLPAG